jgi:hypothetical protein
VTFLILGVIAALAVFACWQATIIITLPFNRLHIATGWIFFRLMFYIGLPVALSLWLLSVVLPMVR